MISDKLGAATLGCFFFGMFLLEFVFERAIVLLMSEQRDGRKHGHSTPAALSAECDFLFRHCERLSHDQAPALMLFMTRSEEHTSELQSLRHLVCRLLLEKKK